MEEIWKDVVDYEGIYLVSNLGRVKSLKFNKERILSTYLSSNGYCKISLRKDKLLRVKLTHQIVAESFLGHKTSGMKLVIDHINDIKTDNRVENLQIVTTRFNSHKTQGNYTSQYKGVSINKKKYKDKVYMYYKSQIQINKKIINLGNFKSEYEAHLAYQNALNNLEL